jgi:glycosyltransferase involved in cell wall biosynthesis
MPASPSRRIGVNALYLLPGGVGGTEIYLRSLLQALAVLDKTNEWFVFVNAETEALAPRQANFHEIRTGVKASSRAGRLSWEQLALPGQCRRLQLDVLWNPGFTAPAWRACPNVTVFHDLQHKRHPEYFRVWELPFWRFFLRLAVWRSDRLIAVSEATRGDLRRFYGVEAATVPHGVDERFFALGEEWSPRPYLLYVSTLHPHKNHERLIRAFSQFRAAHPEYELILAGMKGFAEVELAPGVRTTGWIPREQLYDLYRHAHACVYPSRFEGFGMPVLESLAAGIPTGCSDIEPLRSIVGDAALVFDPDSDEAIVQALTRITADQELRGRLRSAGPRRAREFSWARAAASTLQVLSEA